MSMTTPTTEVKTICKHWCQCSAGETRWVSSKESRCVVGRAHISYRPFQVILLHLEAVYLLAQKSDFWYPHDD